MYIQDTIVAVATPKGQGGVGIIRISGKLAFPISYQITSLSDLTPRKSYYAKFKNQEGLLLDEGILLLFKGPFSFTGEDVAEFQVHGSPVVLDALTEVVCRLGARLARPGEFSERAFLNNKIDLVQAEAISDLIAAGSMTQAKMAMRSLQGEFSARIEALSRMLIELRMYVEAAIDFPEEEIDFLKDEKLLLKFETLLTHIRMIRSKASQGVLIQEGIKLVIVGEPNVGKSTLINALSDREVSIVTDIPGTTRDVMRERIILDGLPIQIVDTAGFRKSDCPVELEGMKRAAFEIRNADLILFMKDATKANESQELEALKVMHEIETTTPTITVFNKVDLLDSERALDNALSVWLSAKTGKGLSTLKEMICSLVKYQPEEGSFMARRRHLKELDEALEWCELGNKELIETGRGELVAENLRLAHLALSRITGEFSADDLLGEIFSSFCIGK